MPLLLLVLMTLMRRRVVDPEWPRWKEEYDMSEGPQGNVFTSTPVNDDAVAGASAS